MSDTTERLTMRQFVSSRSITMDVEWTDHNPNMDDSGNMDHWRCTLKLGRRRLTVVFSMGIGHNGREPKAPDVLDSLASDAARLSGCFEDWCADYGYDTDSRRAERTWKACQRIKRQLRQFLGEQECNRLMYDTERL